METVKRHSYSSDYSAETGAETGTETGTETSTEIVTLELSASETAVLRCIANMPSVTIGGIAEETRLSSSGVRYVLDRLRTKGLVKREGSQKRGRWLTVNRR